MSIIESITLSARPDLIKKTDISASIKKTVYFMKTFFFYYLHSVFSLLWDGAGAPRTVTQMLQDTKSCKACKETTEKHLETL